MAEASTFRGVIQFFDQVGLYDVVLPFILVFTIVFAILEKTKVLGTEKVGEKDYSRKNLNAMVAFVISFLVIASSSLVSIITKVSSQMVILLLMSVLFLLLVGSFYKDAEGGYLKGSWQIFFMVVMFVGIVFIFLGAVDTGNGTWLEILWNYLSSNGAVGGDAIGAIILLVVLVLLMFYVIKAPSKGAVIPGKK